MCLKLLLPVCHSDLFGVLLQKDSGQAGMTVSKTRYNDSPFCNIILYGLFILFCPDRGDEAFAVFHPDVFSYLHNDRVWLDLFHNTIFAA